jgi:hypothetical protein
VPAAAAESTPTAELDTEPRIKMSTITHVRAGRGAGLDLNG